MKKIVFNLDTEDCCCRCKGHSNHWSGKTSWHFCKIRLANQDIFGDDIGTHKGCNQFKAQFKKENTDPDNEY
jgi:hypothetical protein